MSGIRKIFLLCLVQGFVSEGVVPAGALEAVSGFSDEGAVVSYKVVENEFSRRSVFELCPECLSGDKTASEIKSLSVAACEQIVNSGECQGVNPKYLRDCEKEEKEESNLAFGQRVLGCMKGAALEGAIGLGVGAVMGKVIMGIGALLSLPVVGPALGITAGGGAVLYVFSEYDRAYREVDPGDGRAMRAMGQLLGNMGTGIYRLLLGNYECYSSEGRAWEVCGLFLGGALGGKMVVRTTKKAAQKKAAAKKALEDPRQVAAEARVAAARAEREAALEEKALARAQEIADREYRLWQKAKQDRIQRKKQRRGGRPSLADDLYDLFH